MSSGFKLVIDVAKSDSIKNLFNQLFSPSTKDLLDHKRFLIMILIFSGLFAPRFPGLELFDLSFTLSLHGGKFELQEDFLLEPKLSH